MTDQPVSIWMTIGEIAERDGISKQAVSRQVAKMIEEHDIPVQRDARGRVARVALAHWERHRQLFVNPAKRPVPAEPAASAEVGEARDEKSFNEARRRNEWLKLDSGMIDRAERLGRLIPVERYTAALETCGREIKLIIERLQNRADDLALAVGKEGVHGLRVALRNVAFDLCNEIADRLAAISAEAPKFDPAIHHDDGPKSGPDA